MRKALLFIAALCLVASSALSADAGNIQEQVWSLYLSPAEKAALAAMSPAGGDAKKESIDQNADPSSIMAAERRNFIAMAEEFARSAPPVAVAHHDDGGVKGSWLTPEGADATRVIFYLHGGAYMIGTANTPQSITAFLTQAVGVRGFSLDYPLAPENPFPAALDNAEKAYRMLLGRGLAAKNIVLAGDSAGGGLTLALLLRIRDARLPLPAGAYLISPWTDLTQSDATHRSKEAVDIALAGDFLGGAVNLYAGEQDLRNPLISPVFAELRGLPPLFIQVGSHEKLLGDSLTIARNAAEADVPVTLSVWPGYPHVFQFYHRDLEGGRKALREAAAFLRAAFEGMVLR